MERPVIRGILFDKDGTLVDYEASWRPVNEAAARLAARGDADLAQALLHAGGVDPVTGRVVADSVIAAGTTRAIAACWIAAGAGFDLDELTARMDVLFRNSVDHMVPVTDLPAFFARLRGRGIRIGIASSDNEASIQAMLARLDLDHPLDFVAGYDSGWAPKPDPAVLHAFCRATGLEPAQVAMVGDNTHDMATGRRAGAGLSIGVLTGTGTRESLSPTSDLCLESIDELEAVLFG